MTLPLLYLHGFGSSGHSGKAQVLRSHFPEVYAPSLSHVPQLAVETLEEFIRALDGRVALVGSSLGGFFALYLAQRHELPAVLINPALFPERALDRVLGMNQSYFDGSRFETTEAHVASLARYRVVGPDTSRLLLLPQLGDDLLDHRETQAVLPGARAVVEPGGSHAFEGFTTQMETIADFLAEVG